MAFIRLTKGQKILAPKSKVRPSAIRARKALFDMLAHRFQVSFEDKIIIDGFAGAGTLGFEALVRGAGQVIFIDKDKNATEQIMLSAQQLKVNDRLVILHRDMARLGARPQGFFAADIVFLDPPYYQGLEQSALAGLHQGGWLKKDSLIVLESAADDDIVLDNFTLSAEHKIGNKVWRMLTALK